MKIEKPDHIVWKQMGHFAFERWFEANVEPINKLLAEGVEVYANHNKASKGYAWTVEHWTDSDTHKALLIGIEPIKPKTKEERALDLLREMLAEWEDAKEGVEYFFIVRHQYNELKALLSEDEDEK